MNSSSSAIISSSSIKIEGSVVTVSSGIGSRSTTSSAPLSNIPQLVIRIEIANSFSIL